MRANNLKNKNAQRTQIVKNKDLFQS